ncbi:hypothetical protein M9458_026265, partial [Cirrhinus mrigala]
DALFHPEYLLLLLEQGTKSLEDHTRLLLVLAQTTSYLDDALSSKNGPQKDFAAFMEYTLARNRSPFTICPVDDLARSTPDPEPSPPSPCCAELKPEPTVDGEPELTADLGLLEAEGVFNMDMYADLPPLLPPSSEPAVTAIPELSPEKAPMPALPLLPPPLLSSGSPSTHLLSSICAVGSLRVCQSPSALKLEDPL